MSNELNEYKDKLSQQIFDELRENSVKFRPVDLTEFLTALEKRVKREVAENLQKEWNELDQFCKKCDEGNEDTYNWCDFSCLLMNEISGLMRTLGFYTNEKDEIVEIEENVD